jgi:quercetin 2,3-dioxygenase
LFFIFLYLIDYPAFAMPLIFLLQKVFNKSLHVPLLFILSFFPACLQVWITPDATGHAPQYGSSIYEKKDRYNALLQVLGGTKAPPKWSAARQIGDPIALHQDANVFVSENDPGVEHQIFLGTKRQAYLICIEGSMTVAAQGPSEAEETLRSRDAADLVAGAKEVPLILKAGDEGAHFMLIEMKQQS